MASDQNFLVCRSFVALRTRLLLLKQVELKMIEDELEELENTDAKEGQTARNLRLCTRYYADEKKDRLDEIQKCLRSYGKVSNRTVTPASAE